jgi:hypothetical protein
VKQADYYERHHSQRITGRALQTLGRQGYRVTLEPAVMPMGHATADFLSSSACSCGAVLVRVGPFG